MAVEMETLTVTKRIHVEAVPERAFEAFTEEIAYMTTKKASNNVMRSP